MFVGDHKWWNDPPNAPLLGLEIKWAVFHEESRFKKGVLVLFVRSYRTCFDTEQEALDWIGDRVEDQWLVKPVVADIFGSGEVFMSTDSKGRYLLRRGQ